MTDAEFKDLCASIKANGLHNAIITLDDMILDGQHRHNACLQSGVAPRFKDFRTMENGRYKDADPRAFVMSQNLSRRHLNASQRAILAAEIANAPVGKRGYSAKLRNITVAEAAEAANVSPRSVSVGKRLLKLDKNLAANVKKGDITLNKADKLLQAAKKPLAEPPAERRPTQSTQNRVKVIYAANLDDTTIPAQPAESTVLSALKALWLKASPAEKLAFSAWEAQYSASVTSSAGSDCHVPPLGAAL